MRKTKLHIKGHSTTTQLRDEVQVLLREIAKLRDGGCVLRNYPETGSCGGYRKDGELIVQFDHLNSRTHAISFSDVRCGVLVCQRHHIYYKRQNGPSYEKCVMDSIGEKRRKLVERVRADKSPYKVDLKLDIVGLKEEFKKLQKNKLYFFSR